MGLIVLGILLQIYNRIEYYAYNQFLMAKAHRDIAYISIYISQKLDLSFHNHVMYDFTWERASHHDDDDEKQYPGLNQLVCSHFANLPQNPTLSFWEFGQKLTGVVLWNVWLHTIIHYLWCLLVQNVLWITLSWCIFCEMMWEFLLRLHT